MNLSRVLDLTPVSIYCHLMAMLPVVVPDGAKIRQIMWDRGWSVTEFARKLQLTQQADDAWADVTALDAKTLYNVRSLNKRISVGALRLIAAVLEVDENEIILRRIKLAA